MLHGRENLKKELEIKSIIASVLGTEKRAQSDCVFRKSKKGSDGETVIWMNAVKGVNSGETLEVTQIQVEKRVEVSDI